MAGHQLEAEAASPHHAAIQTAVRFRRDLGVIATAGKIANRFVYDPHSSGQRLHEPLHDRMPVILSPDEFAPWLDPVLTGPEQLWPMIDQYPADEMTTYPVSMLVGLVRNDSPELIAANNGKSDERPKS